MNSRGGEERIHSARDVGTNGKESNLCPRDIAAHSYVQSLGCVGIPVSVALNFRCIAMVATLNLCCRILDVSYVSSLLMDADIQCASA